MVEPISRDREMLQFVISNLETVASGNVIYISGTDGKEALAVFPQTVATLLTDSRFRISSPNSLVTGFIVGQLFLRPFDPRSPGTAGAGNVAAQTLAGGGGGGIFGSGRTGLPGGPKPP